MATKQTADQEVAMPPTALLAEALQGKGEYRIHRETCKRRPRTATTDPASLPFDAKLRPCTYCKPKLPAHLLNTGEAPQPETIDTPEAETTQPQAPQEDPMTATATSTKKAGNGKSDAELVSQLLAIAEDSGATEAERKIARERAERLMVKTGITEAVARAGGKRKDEEIVMSDPIQFSGTLAKGYLAVGVSIARGLGAEAVQSSRSYSQATLWVIGYQSDINRVVRLIESAQVQAQLDLEAYWAPIKEEFARESQNAKFLERRAFLFGFANGVQERLEDATTEVAEDAGPGTDLVLRDREQAVANYVGEHFGKARRTCFSNRPGALMAGAAAGRRANLNQSAVTTD